MARTESRTKLVISDPDETVGSLVASHGMVPTMAALLWLRQVVEPLGSIEDLPHNVVLQDRTSATGRPAVDWAARPGPPRGHANAGTVAGTGAFVAPSSCDQKVRDDVCKQLPPPWGDALARVYAALRAAAAGKLGLDELRQCISECCQPLLFAEPAIAQGIDFNGLIHQLSHVQSILAAGVQNTSQAQQPFDRLLEKNHVLQRQCEEAVATANNLTAELARVRAAYFAQGRDFEALKASAAWRVMERIRRLLSGFSQGHRNLLRRMAKAIWWAVTPHRMPARIRFLKRRRAPSAFMRDATAWGMRPMALRFVPEPDKRPGGTATESGSYLLAEGHAPYVYIPQRLPDDLEQVIAGFSRRPFFSLVVPAYNTPVELLQRLLASVRQQWYPHWQLVLVDDNSPAEATRDALSHLVDPRIKVIRLDSNRGISGATNVAIEQAEGDYVVFLDHDDELTTDCLFELARCIDVCDPDFVYSDEDKIDTDGSFTQPFFKPDWSPDTMMSTMFTCHVSCVRRALALELGGLRSEYDGSQDWDFILRLTERTDRIVHIPKVLYHWRIIPASVSSDLAAKPYAVDAGRRAREDALRRRGLSGELRPVPQIPGYYRTHYHLRGQPLFSIVIPSKNNGTVLRACVDSIIGKSDYRHFEIIAIDNGSTDRATLAILEELGRHPQVRVVRHDMPFNYSEINNVGVQHAGGDIMVFLNDDTEVLTGEWLQCLGGYAQLAHVGAVGAKLLYPETLQVQHSGIVNLANGPGHAFQHAHKDAPGYFARNLLECDWIGVTGACMMLERAKLELVGGFDESLPVAYNDVELCFRLVERGYYNVVCPAVELLHHESLSRGLDAIDDAKRMRLEREKLRLYQKHSRFYMFDPFHNPNFAPNDIHFGLS